MKTIQNCLATAFTAAFVAATSATSFAQTTVTITTGDSTESVTRTEKFVRKADRVTSDFSIYLGINGFGNTLPTAYDLRPIGSRFVALSWQKRIPVATSGTTKIRLVTGPEVAWNNFMFENKTVLTDQNGQVTAEASTVSLRKSKFVTTQLNLPLMVNVQFKSGFSISAGAYAGVRLDSYTAQKPENGRTIRTRGSFELNPVRWGLTTELGFRGCSKLFVRYEPNSPFRAGQTPDSSVWAVGIKL